MGSRLIRSQVLIISGAFIVFTGFGTWGVIQYYSNGHDAWLALDNQKYFPGSLDLNPAHIAAPMLALGIVGALKFMWDIRHPKAK